MAIVPNLNNSPISPVTPLVDPHNEGKLEVAFNNDIVRTDASLNMTGGNQLILAANQTRRAVRITNPDGNNDVGIGIVPMTAVNSKGAHTLFAGNSYDFMGKLAANTFYVYGTNGQGLTILVG